MIIPNIWDFIVDTGKPNRIIAISTNRELRVYDYSENYRFLGNDFQAINHVNSEIWAFNYESLDTYVLKKDDYSLDRIIPFVCGFKQKHISNTTSITCLIRIQKDHFLGVVDLLLKTIISKSPVENFFFINNTIGLFEKNGKWLAKNILGQNIIYTVSIQSLLNSNEAKLFGDLIEYEGKLFFFLSDQNDKFGIYCVEIATGKVLNQTNEIGGFIKLSNGLLYMNTAYVVTTIHTDTFEIKQTDLRSILEPKDLNLGIMMQINLMVGHLYYFVCQNGRSGAATVGIINLEEKSLVWKTEISIESGSYWIKEIQVHGNRLFVLTQGGTLHIFESE